MSILPDYLGGFSSCRLEILAGAGLTTEIIRPQKVSLPDRSSIINRAPFIKRGIYRAISKRPKNPVHQKSGEFRKNGAITFFPGPYRPRTGFFHTGEKNPG